jgi:hypothetical protein
MSLNDLPDSTAFPNADALVPLKAVKALLGVVRAAAVGIGGELKACWPNAETGFAAVPMVLVWPNTDPGVAGTGTLRADSCPPPKALTF